MKYDPINLTNNWENWLKLNETAIDILYPVYIKYFSIRICCPSLIINSETSGNLDLNKGLGQKLASNMGKI